MTTRTEVAADNPLIYWYLDELMGTPINYGNGGANGITVAGNITRMQTGAGSATGNSWRLNPSSAATHIARSSTTSGTSWTFETWVKRGTAGSDWVRILSNMRSAANSENYWEIAIVDEAPGPGVLRLYDSSGTQVTATVPALSDMNWHHVAVTCNNGLIKLYADGAQVGSGTMSVASRTGTFYVGDTRIVGRDSYFDEVAFYPNVALPNGRILAHATGTENSPFAQRQNKAALQAAGTNTFTVTLDAPAVAGSLIVLSIGGDKNTGALTVTTPGFTKAVEQISTSVSLHVAYKVATGGETTVTGSFANTSVSGNRVLLSEYTGVSNWQVEASSSNPSNESNLTSITLNPTGAAAAPGFGLAFVSVDSASSLPSDKTSVGFNAGYINLYIDPSTTGAGGLYVGGRSLVTAGETSSTTFSGLTTADQLQGAILVFGAAAALNVKVSAPAQTLSLAAADATATGINGFDQTSVATADANGGYGKTISNATSTSLTVGSTTAVDYVLMKFATLSTTLDVVSSKLTVFNSTSTSVSYSVYRVLSDWSEVNGNASPNVPSSAAVVSGTLAPGSNEIDITPIAREWKTNPNYGIALYSGSFPTTTIRSREYTAATPQRPTLRTLMEVPTKRVAAPAMLLSVTMPGGQVKIAKAVQVTPMLLALSTPAANTNNTSVIKITAENMPLMLSVPGGEPKNPDVNVAVPAMATSLQFTQAQVSAGQDARAIVTGTMTLSLVTLPATFGNKTERTVKVPAFEMDLDLVDIYNKDVDRYIKIVKNTTDYDDLWFQMEELSGTVATDAAFRAIGPNDQPQLAGHQDGVYVGSPLFNVSGPEGRKAITFDGVDDHLVAGYPGYTGTGQTPREPFFPQSAITIEFSIKTNQKNGVLWAGKDRSFEFVSGQRVERQSEVRLVNGEIVWTDFNGQDNASNTAGIVVARVRKDIADNKWHHIVMSIPSSNRVGEVYYGSDRPPYFVSIDGSVEWTRTLVAANSVEARVVPYSVMARKDFYTGAVTEPLRGTVRDFIVRTNYNVSLKTAQRLYYEWSNTTLVNPEPFSLAMSAIDPTRVKGNIKTMLLVYGLRPFVAAPNGGGTPIGDLYYNVWAGTGIRTDRNANFDTADDYSWPGTVGSGGFQGGLIYPTVRPFNLSGYLVFPVHIAGESQVTTNIPLSAEGITNKDYVGPDGWFVDDRTGIARFIDFDLDLNVDVTDFDALTVYNYPEYAPVSGFGSKNTSGPAMGSPGRRNGAIGQFGYRMTDNEWTNAREAFKAQILKAGNRGVNLWINGPDMAQHLGYIKAWDRHQVVDYVESSDFNAPATQRNLRAQELDRQHGYTDVGGRNAIVYTSTPQGVIYRRIVATEQDLTTMPTWELSDIIVGYKTDTLQPYVHQFAWDVTERANGLRIGDKSRMSVGLQIARGYTGIFAGSFDIQQAISPVSAPRGLYLPSNIISAKPEGIVGKVIAKEQATFYGAGGVEKVNPYADNVTTIAAEVGHVVSGVVINARAFIEFMDTETESTRILRNVPGAGRPIASTWDYDSFRNIETFTYSTVDKLVSDKQSGSLTSVSRTDRAISITSADIQFLPYWSMNARGLNWLTKGVQLDPGEARVRVEHMQLSLSTPDVTPRPSRTNRLRVPAMLMYLELVKPPAIREPNVNVKARPMEMSLQLQGIRKTIKVEGAMSMSMVMVNSVTRGAGDKIPVFLDNDRRIKLFIKEDDQ